MSNIKEREVDSIPKNAIKFIEDNIESKYYLIRNQK